MATDLWAQHRDYIAGVWKCISYNWYGSTGPERKVVGKPHGDIPLGRVTISRQRHLTALMAVPDMMAKPLPSGKPWQLGDDAEVARVARAFDSYCGFFELFENDEGLYWQTKVEICTDPSRVGGIEERRVEFLEEEGGKFYLVLRPTGLMMMPMSFLLFACIPRSGGSISY